MEDTANSGARLVYLRVVGSGGIRNTKYTSHIINASSRCKKEENESNN